MRLRISLALLLLACALALAQHEPFVTHESRPAITHGPLLLTPTETSATIVWTTDKPAHSKVLYGSGGKLDRVAEPQMHGLKPIGTRHAVELRGLEPGVAYQYRAVSTEVVRMKTYWPEKGRDVESATATFTTFDRRKPRFSFTAITDTHANLDRIAGLMPLVGTGDEFLVHLGDAFDTEIEEMIWTRWLDPLLVKLGPGRPLLYARGNHEARGAAARMLMDNVRIPEKRFYYARDHGPVHFIVLDTGEDKPDETNVYARLNAFREYKREELAWLKEHLKTDPRARQAAFRVLLMHAPDWGWVGAGVKEWTMLANQAGIDLSISGHTHRFSHSEPGEKGRQWHQLVIGPTQAARVEVSEKSLAVSVRGPGGAEVKRFTVPVSKRRARR